VCRIPNTQNPREEPVRQGSPSGSSPGVFDCEDWGGTYSEVEELEGGTTHSTDGYPDHENVETTRILGRCDIVNPYGGWIQLWYDPEVGAEPIEICSGPAGQPGDCWEP
jgi:hypothetical protein